MDFKQLEAFAAVVEQNSFSRAAEALYLSQPTISAHISQLEKELDTKLLLRTTKALQPTETGQLLYDYARKLLDIRAEACSAVSEKAHSDGAPVRIAASTVPSRNYLPGFMTAYKHYYPSAAFEVYTGDSENVESMVLSGKAELGFMGRLPNGSRCIAVPFADDSLVIITPNSSRYQHLVGAKFPAMLLYMEPYVSRENGSGTRLESERFLREIGVDPAQLMVAAETNTTENVVDLVSEGLGISIISSTAAREAAEFGSILSFEPEHYTPSRRLYMIRLRNAVLSPEAKKFSDFIKHTCAL